MEDNKLHSFWSIVKNGIFCKCPNCGKGRLFKGYLTHVTNCSVCDEHFGDIKPEDGPAWLTILIVGHILAPFLLAYDLDATWPEWISMVLWPLLALILVLIILPRAKGLFIAMIWRTQCSGASK